MLVSLASLFHIIMMYVVSVNISSGLGDGTGSQAGSTVSLGVDTASEIKGVANETCCREGSAEVLWVEPSSVIGVANETGSETGSSRVREVDNEVRVAGLFDIYSDPQCTEINRASVQTLESVIWIFEHLNSHQYIPGVKLALRPYKTCRSPRLASLQTARIVSEMDNKTIMGVIGPSTSAEMVKTSEILSSLPDHNRLPQIVYEPTSSLFTKEDKYNRLFRVIPPDNIQVKTIIAVLKKLKWNYIAIIRDDDTHAVNTTDTLQELAKSENICISTVKTVGQISPDLQETYNKILTNLSKDKINGIVFFGSHAHARSYIILCEEINDRNLPSAIFSDAASSTTFLHTGEKVQKSLFLSPPTRDINEFADHWKNIVSNQTYRLERAALNPWLTNASDWDTDQSIYVQYSVKAAYTIAQALRSLHRQLCRGNFSGVCPDFIKAHRHTLINYISNMSVNFTDFPFTISSFVEDGLKIQFDSQGEIQLLSPHVPMYEVFRYQDCSGATSGTICKNRVAQYKNEVLNSTEIFQEEWSDKAQCSGTCVECMTTDLPSEDIYQPGDLMVLGLMPLHDRGSNSPFTCGGIRSKIGLEIALAIRYVVETVNNDSNMFRDKTIGYKIMDTCNDPIVTQKRILDMVLEEEGCRKKILGVVGPLGSTATLAAAGIFSSLGIPQVGCCSSARILSNTNLYPTFLRVSTSIYKQVELMVKLASKLLVNYIQVVYSEGEFGESARDATLYLAREYKICVVNNTVSIGEHGDDYKVLPHIRRYPNARLVFLFIRSHKVAAIAQALNEQMNDGDNFIFMASDSWGKRQDNIFGKRELRGMITISQEMGYDQGYDRFLRSINVTQERYENSFLERFAEARLGCYFELSFNKTGKPKCSENHMIKSDTLDPYHSFVLNAAHALLQGADEAFKQRPAFHENGEFNFLLDHIKKVHQKYGTPEGSLTNMFDDKGDGTVGFHIYNVQINETTDQVLYVKVGQWKDESLKFNKDELDDKTESLDSVCKNSGGFCDMCYYGPDSHLHEQEKDTQIALFVVIGVLAGILATLFGRRIYRCVQHRRKQAQERQSEDDIYYLPTF